MAFEVYEENLDEVREEAMATLNATRDKPIDPRRYDWLYRENPDGKAVMWSIRNTDTGEMAGFTVALPRRVLVDGKVRVCWNGADFSIRKKFRTLGVAMKLRRAAKEGVDAGRVDFLYANPNAKMQVIHEKVGHRPVGTMVRYARVIRSEPYLRRRFGGRALPAVAGKAADGILRLRDAGRRRRPVFSTRVVESPRFDERFDRLFDEVRSSRRVVGIRDARYLDWRWARNPLHPTHAVLAEDNGRLAGYALFTTDKSVVHVKDVFAASDEARADLAAELVRHARQLRADSVSAVVLQGHPAGETLQQFGFARREDTSQMFGYAAEGSSLSNVVLAQNSWLFSVGDRDV